jgi:hypothetical protein
MEFQRRRIAVRVANMADTPSPTTTILDAFQHATIGTETTTAHATSTVAPYDTGLTGVDQARNLLFKDMMWWTLGIMALVILAVRCIELVQARLRQMTTANVSGTRQGYWKFAQWSWMPGLKKHLIYAPLWNKRHTKELRLSSAVNVGTLPSRFQSLILGTYLISNIVYMFVLNWKNENRYAFCAELRGRSGTMALVNMIPLIIFAGRNNPLISLLKISFDTYNLMHRWMGRVVVIETCIHTIAWAVVQVAADGWQGVANKMIYNRFIASGTLGTICMIMLAILAIGPLRHAFYETFVNVHIMLALVIFICTWVHCVSPSLPGGLPQLPWIVAIMLIWMADRLARVARLAYCNRSERGWTEALVEPMEGEVTRVTLHLPRFVDVKPGTHAYLRFLHVNPWESHPFSIAWVQHHPDPDILPTGEKELKNPKMVSTSVSFIIGAQSGMTRKLYDNTKGALKSSPVTNPVLKTRAAFEGPYAGHHCLDSYGHLVLFAGATGITHQLSYMKHLCEGVANGSVSTRRVTLIWIVRDQEALEWTRPWMDHILRLPGRQDLITIKLFVTRPKTSRPIGTSSNVQIFPGRPNVPMLIQKEVQEQVGAMCVSVCGPGSLADDVRAATREVQEERTVVDFIEESFSW